MIHVIEHLVSAFRARKRPHGDDATLVAEIAIWSATADGHLDAEELADLAAHLRTFPGLEAFDTERGMKQFEELRDTYRDEDSIAARIAEIAMSIESRDARRAAYRLALWCAARDGHFSEEETAFLENLQECLEIDDGEAEALLDETIER